MGARPAKIDRFVQRSAYSVARLRAERYPSRTPTAKRRYRVLKQLTPKTAALQGGIDGDAVEMPPGS
jgi:hypothetical protein